MNLQTAMAQCNHLPKTSFPHTWVIPILPIKKVSIILQTYPLFFLHKEKFSPCYQMLHSKISHWSPCGGYSHKGFSMLPTQKVTSCSSHRSHPPFKKILIPMEMLSPVHPALYTDILLLLTYTLAPCWENGPLVSVPRNVLIDSFINQWYKTARNYFQIGLRWFWKDMAF